MRRLGWIISLTVILMIEIVPSGAQTADNCQTIPCGPSSTFTRETFPTIAGIDFKAFPVNSARPYKIKGKTWYVSDKGSDSNAGTTEKPFATISQAVTVAQSGDAVQVADGTYRVGTGPESGIVLEKPGITLFAANIGKAILQSTESDSGNVIEARADDLVIDGFMIRVAPRGYGIEFGRLDRPQRNLVLKNLLIEGGESGLSSVIVPTGQANAQPVIKGLLVNHVAIRNATLVGFNCGQGPCHDMRLENFTVQMPADKNVETSGADAVGIENGDNILVFNAELSGASADGLDTKATRVAAVNVVIHDVARNGLKFWKGGDAINTLIYNTGADAAVVFESGNTYRLLHVIVARHEFKNPGGAYAMTVAVDSPNDSGSLAIINSIFYQNSGAIHVSGKFKLDIRNNIFFGSGNGQQLVWAREPEIAVGEQDAPIKDLEAAGGGSGNKGFIDPKFVNPDKGQFRLQAGSPAFDAGAAGLKDAPDFDLLGNPRTVGKAPDLGPVEQN